MIWLLLIAGLVVRVVIAVTKPEVLWIDDTFYSLGIARNIALGYGWTHDGLHVTNGFQPLHVFLIVPLYFVLPIYGRFIPIFILLIQCIQNIVSGFIIFLVIEKLLGIRSSIIFLVIFSFSPYIISGINGLETTLQLFLFSIITYLYIFRWQGRLTKSDERLGNQIVEAAALGGGLACWPSHA